MKILQILVLIFGLAVFVNAQKAILSGTLYDAVGAVIPEVKVTAVNEKGEKFEAITNNEGVYSLNLPYNLYEARTSSANFKIAKFEIIVDLEYRGFEKFVVKDFKFIPAYSGNMFFDIALDSRNPEPCGYAGADCLNLPLVETNKTKPSDKIQQRPLEKLPKAQKKSSIQLTGKIFFSLDGASIPNIKIVVTSQAQKKYEQKTNEEGIYRFDLPEGIYTIEINPQDIKYNTFESIRFENYPIAPTYDRRVNLDIPLSVIGNSVVCMLTVSDSSKQPAQPMK